MPNQRKFAGMRILMVSILGLSFFSIKGQNGANGVFSILRQVPNARTNAWGGYSTAYRNGDATFFQNNPALLSSSAHNRATLNFNTQLPGVWSGNGAYGLQYKNLGYFAAAIGFINYGTMDAYDAGGNYEGIISANETVLSVGYAKNINKQISFGAGIKMAYSILAGYVANGLAFDFGGVYTSKDTVISVGMAMKNAGFMVGHYRDGDREPLPFQAELGVNFKPKHMPFRFNIVYHDLQKFDLTYNQYLSNELNIDLNGNAVVAKEAVFGDKLLRHITLGTELVLGKNFGILAGYNHQKRKEMAPEEAKGVAGYSWGLHLRISKFNITYSSAAFFPGFNTNLFTFSTNLSDFNKKSPSSQNIGGSKN